MKKQLFDDISIACSIFTTRKYSTSFSLGIHCLHRKFHHPIYAIYGFVRFADEIVDSFEGYDQSYLLNKFWKDTHDALKHKISLNPILNSFQRVVHDYNIDVVLIETFLKSMEMDLNPVDYTMENYEQYILGSAEVVGLMCLAVFTEGNKQQYEHLTPSAMKLGAAFQKVNFLRDAKSDYEELGRTYFPNVDLNSFTKIDKEKIELEIEEDFKEAFIGIQQLPKEARQGVYIAYIYYMKLFNKIKATPAERILSERIRIPNLRKFWLMFNSLLRHKLNALRPN